MGIPKRARSPMVGLALGVLIGSAVAPGAAAIGLRGDSDRDGLPDSTDTCPEVTYAPAFDWNACGPLDGDPGNDADPECKARERVVDTLLHGGAFTTHLAFSVIVHDTLHFADAFTYVGSGQYEHDPDGIFRLYRIGSTSKAVVATTSKIMEERGELSLGDFVDRRDHNRPRSPPS